MRDPDLVVRAQRAATALELAWHRWRSMHGLEADPLPPVSSYVGYSLEEPWGQPRVLFGVGAEEAEQLAALLDRHDCVGPVHATVVGLPGGQQQAAQSGAGDRPNRGHVHVPAQGSASAERRQHDGQGNRAQAPNPLDPASSFDATSGISRPDEHSAQATPGQDAPVFREARAARQAQLAAEAQVQAAAEAQVAADAQAAAEARAASEASAAEAQAAREAQAAQEAQAAGEAQAAREAQAAGEALARAAAAAPPAGPESAMSPAPPPNLAPAQAQPVPSAPAEAQLAPAALAEPAPAEAAQAQSALAEAQRDQDQPAPVQAQQDQDQPAPQDQDQPAPQDQDQPAPQDQARPALAQVQPVPVQPVPVQPVPVQPVPVLARPAPVQVRSGLAAWQGPVPEGVVGPVPLRNPVPAPGQAAPAASAIPLAPADSDDPGRPSEQAEPGVVTFPSRPELVARAAQQVGLGVLVNETDRSADEQYQHPYPARSSRISRGHSLPRLARPKRPSGAQERDLTAPPAAALPHVPARKPDTDDRKTLTAMAADAARWAERPSSAEAKDTAV